jgi:hypothetical protein
MTMIKKLRRIAAFVAGAGLGLAISFLFTGYGNKLVHPTINEGIIYKFQDNFLNGIFTIDKFKNYSFVFESTLGMKGPMVISGGLEFINSGEFSNNAFDWIKHGGFSADEPELPASFRHFYDPTEPAGQRYLKDHLTYLEQKIHITFNPRIDIINWCVDHPDNAWTWEKGKAFLRTAFQSTNDDDKEANMAKAYRCLGETLHLIADMGCVPHVRDDSHPTLSVFGSPWGNADPYEELFQHLVAEIPTYTTNQPDATLKSTFRGATDVKTIAQTMAAFTNQNFFSNQTISGASVIPQIHPEKTYASPKLEQCSYNALNYTYTKTVGGQTVKMCKDLTYLWHIIENRGYPYIDEECVRSQGAVLIPNIVEAGSNVIRLFIPAIKVEITEIKEDSTIKGIVTHTTDQEYPATMKYNGNVDILESSSFTKLGTLTCVNGAFEGKLTNLAANSKIRAQIAFGYIYVKSEEMTVNASDNLLRTLHTMKKISVECSFDYSIVSGSSSATGISSSTLPGDSITWNGTSFSYSYVDEEPYDDNGYKNNRYLTVTGTVSSDAKTVTQLIFDYKTESYYYYDAVPRLTNTEKMIIVDIPVEHYPGYQDWGTGSTHDDFLYTVGNSECLQHVSSAEWRWIDRSWSEDWICTKANILRFWNPIQITFSK